MSKGSRPKAKGKKHKEGKKPKVAIRVEDHGNGFVVVGTNDIPKARDILRRYVGDAGLYRFASLIGPYEGSAHAVWLCTAMGEWWEGAEDLSGRSLR